MPIIEKYKDRLLAIGEVSPLVDQMMSNADLHGIHAVISTSDLTSVDSYFHSVQPADNSVLLGMRPGKALL